MPAKMRWSVSVRFKVCLDSRSRAGKAREVGGEDLKAAGVACRQSILSLDQSQRRPLLRARLGEEQRAGGKVEFGERIPMTPALRSRPRRAAPAQAPSDHQVDNDEDSAFQLQDDLLRETSYAHHDATPNLLDRRRHRPQHKGARQADVAQHLAGDPAVQVVQVYGEIRQLRHSLASLKGCGAPSLHRVPHLRCQVCDLAPRSLVDIAARDKRTPVPARRLQLATGETRPRPRTLRGPRRGDQTCQLSSRAG